MGSWIPYIWDPAHCILLLPDSYHSGKTSVRERIQVQLQIFSPQTSHALAWYRTWTSGIKCRQLDVEGKVRPFSFWKRARRHWKVSRKSMEFDSNLPAPMNGTAMWNTAKKVCVFSYLPKNDDRKHICAPRPTLVNLLKPTGHVMHQQFNIQQELVLPTLYLCVLYLSENKQRLVPLTT